MSKRSLRNRNFNRRQLIVAERINRQSPGDLVEIRTIALALNDALREAATAGAVGIDIGRLEAARVQLEGIESFPRRRISRRRGQDDRRLHRARHQRGKTEAVAGHPEAPTAITGVQLGSAVVGRDFVATTNIYIGDGAFLLQTSVLGVPQEVMTEPSFEWPPLSDAFEDGEPNLFSLLRWDYRLVETLYGRDDDLRKILDWAESGSRTASARLITGEGGAGKTRLAAQAAQRLRDKGWTAGFLPRHRNGFNFAVRDKGLFLILDYPEEQPERTVAILKELAERKTAPYPFRVLFVSRRSFAEWEGETTILQGRFGRQEIASPAPLSVEDGERRIAAARRLAERNESGMPDLRGARSWLANSPLHRLPLYATAAAIHAVRAPAEAFGLSGAERFLKKLAGREMDRVRPVSESMGLGRNGLERLLALGVAGRRTERSRDRGTRASRSLRSDEA